MRQEIKEEYMKDLVQIEFIRIDLSNLSTIRPAADEFLSKENRLDIIIHNAGIMNPPPNSKSVQGYELQLGTNVLGPFLLQKLLDPLIIETSKSNSKNLSRIIWVTSLAQFNATENGGINWEDINYENQTRKYSRYEIYGSSKAGTIICATQWSKKHPEAENVISIALAPGFLKTNLQKNLPFFERHLYNLLIMRDPIFGAYTEMFGAVSPDVTVENNDGKNIIIPFGRFGHSRKDINESAKGNNGEKYWTFLEEQVSRFS